MILVILQQSWDIQGNLRETIHTFAGPSHVDGSCCTLTILYENVARIDGLPAYKQIFSVHRGHLNDSRIILALVNIPHRVIDDPTLLVRSGRSNIGICLLNTHLLSCSGS